MARPWPLVLAVSLAVGPSFWPAPTQPSASASAVERTVGRAADAGSPAAPLPHHMAPVPATVDPIVPGSVNRSSPFLDATYQANLVLTWGARTIRVDSTATVRNTSGGPIDRIEFNTIAAKLGAMRLGTVTVDGHAVTATVSGQTIVVPLGGTLPVDGTTRVRIRFGATLRSSLAGSNWLFTRTNGVADLYRWLPWVSRRIQFERPNHGDPFETPTSRLVAVRIQTNRPLKVATTGDRRSISADGTVQTFVAHDVRDFTVTAALDYRTRERTVAGTIVRLYYRPGAPAAAMLDAAADAFGALRSRLGAYPYPTFKVVQSAGGYGMESPRLIWIPTGVSRSNLRYLVTHETAHQWFYGLAGNDQASEPFTDEAAADFVARNVLGQKRASRCAAARLDRSIYEYSAACYYETIYIQGGNLLDRARRAMGSAAFWPALRGYVAANRNRIVRTSTLLNALDSATPIDLGATLFGPRFPRLY
jgi:hypothetical protein